MSLSAKLQQRQTQSLVMTPQLAQSIKLLQYNHVELLDFIKDEVEKNPLLELAGNEDVRPVRGEKSMESDSVGSLQSTDSRSDSTADAELVSQSGPALENIHDVGTAGAEKQEINPAASAPVTDGRIGPGAAISEEFDFLANLGEAPDLIGHLKRQIAFEFRGDEERHIATDIAHGLDEDGYFREDLKETAVRNRTTIDMVAWVLERFQGFEPVGIGARDLGECLKLQLQDKNRYDPAMKILLENIDLLAKRKFSELVRLCGVNKEDFSDMLSEIRALDPRPARAFEPVLSETVVPDVLISQNPSGAWNIELNPETLPRVLVNNEYHAELTTALGDSDMQKFVSGCMENANWLTKSLDQRAKTILKVATEIVKQQDRFFDKGPKYLVPLTLKQVADTIKMHESTVSRVTSNKYLMCDRGTFELKYFFSSAISSNNGESTISAEAVKHLIQKMVSAEKPDKILSDEQIVSNLEEAGIEIARRTVAKYRETLHIASSVQRRREKSGNS
ncbi:MAG: RNA polymerase factor sigma-54 [Rhizobiaceae bacterium]